MRTYISKIQVKNMRNEEEAVAYIGLKMMYDKMLTVGKESVEVDFTIGSLFYGISGSMEMNRTDYSKLNKGIQGLAELGLVKILAQDGKGFYSLDIAGLKIEDDEAYTTMDRDEIRKVLNIPCRQKFNLLRFAVALFGTINSSYKCGWASFKTMSELSNISRIRSCQDHFKLLEENGVIYVRHCETVKIDEDGNIKALSNVYGRPEDKEAIDAYYLDRCCQEGYKFGKKDKEDEAAETAQEAVEAPQEPHSAQIPSAETQDVAEEKAAQKVNKEQKKPQETTGTDMFSSTVSPIEKFLKLEKKTDSRPIKTAGDYYRKAAETTNWDAARALEEELKAKRAAFLSGRTATAVTN